MIEVKSSGYQFVSTVYSVKEVLNGKDVLTLTIPAKGEDAQHIASDIILLEKTYSKSEFVVKSINGDDDETEVTAALNLDDFNVEIYEGFSKTGRPYNILNEVVPAGWTVEDRSGISSSKTVELEAPTAEEVADSVIDVFGVAIRYDFEHHLQIVYNPKSMENGGEYATKELNLVSLSRYQNSYDLKNRLYVYGKDGLSFADINDGKPYVDDMTYLKDRIRSKRIKDDRFTDKESLLEYAKSTLASISKPMSSYECTPADIGATDTRYAFLKLELMSIVTLLDVDTNTRVDHQVVERVVWPHDKARNSLTLSATAPSFTGKFDSVVDQIVTETNKIDKKIEDYVGDLTDQILSASGGHVVINYGDDGKMAEILLMDTNDKATAVKVMRFNMGGIAFSTSGYNGPFNGIMGLDGKWFAQYLATWELSASIIVAGILRSQDGETFYLDLENGILRMKATEFTVEGKTVDEIADEKAQSAKEEAQKALDEYAEVVTSNIQNLQGQIDGQIQTWFYDYAPTAYNEPASSWVTNEDKEKHLGDLFYIVDNSQQGGQAYRWALVYGTYKWVLIEDTEVAKALADAAKAQDTADGKRRVFVTQPVPPYEVGDLWSQGPTGSLMVCKTSRQSGYYYASDWQSSADYINESTAEEVADNVVSKIELGVTNADAFSDILGSAVWTEPHGEAYLQGAELTLVGGSSEAWASLYVPTENLEGLAGKRVRITLEYQIQETVGGAACRNTLWYVYKNEAGGGYYINTITTGANVSASSQWHKVSWETTLKNDIVTKLQLTANLGAGGYGTVKFRNVTFEAVAGVRSAVSLSKDGVQISVATLGDYATASDYASLRLSQSELSLSVVKNGEVRSKFAADTESVTISSGVITFASDTLVVDSQNFKLDRSGTVSISGSFYSETQKDKVSVYNGTMAIDRKISDGSWRRAINLWAYGNNASNGYLQIYGPGVSGTEQVLNVSANGNYSGGSFNIYNAAGQRKFQVLINGNGDAEVWVNGSKKF